MTRPRNQQVVLEATPYYHCISRCVRRAFLCGQDRHTGQSFEHRKVWVVERLAALADVFAVDVCAYAVMSNHYHLVLRVNTAQAEAWSDQEVAEQWMKLFSGSLLVQRWLARTLDDIASEQRALEIIALWRKRLCDLSWFMRCLNEHLARRANEEDGCTGRFWEGRFKTQALLDEAAVLACMAYVDLNPIRAGIADLPEESAHTSIQQRIRELAAGSSRSAGKTDDTKKPQLLPMLDAGNADSDNPDTVLGYRLMDYLELIDWTGRATRQGKRGAIDRAAPKILQRLGIDTAMWLRHMRPRRNRMLAALGAVAQLRQYIEATGRKWLVDQKSAVLTR